MKRKNTTIHTDTSKYMEHIPNKPTTTSTMDRKVYEFILAIKFSRRREHEPSASRTLLIDRVGL